MAKKVVVLKPFEYKSKRREEDEEVRLPDSIAEEVVNKGTGSTRRRKKFRDSMNQNPEENQVRDLT